MNIRQSFKARYIGIPIKGILLWRTIAPGKYYEIETVKHTDGISVRIETAETWIKYTDADFNKNWRIENDDSSFKNKTGIPKPSNQSNDGQKG